MRLETVCLFIVSRRVPGRIESISTKEEERTNTALLLPIPAAEQVVGPHRRKMDLAAADGIPTHVTVAFPFKPLGEMDEKDHAQLTCIGRQHGPVKVEGCRTAWFGDQVLYVEVSTAQKIHALTVDVASAFPAYPPYSGDIPLAQIVPHLTVAAAPVPALQAAARLVDDALPIDQVVQSMELWTGPSVVGRTQPARWARVRSYARFLSRSPHRYSRPSRHDRSRYILSPVNSRSGWCSVRPNHLSHQSKGRS